MGGAAPSVRPSGVDGTGAPGGRDMGMEAGMSDGARRSGDGIFGVLDPKLTVYALANGMDLAKGEGYRRLEWFTEGLERGILIEPADADTFRVAVMSWRTGRAEHRSKAQVAEGLAAEKVTKVLDDAIESANALEAPPAGA